MEFPRYMLWRVLYCNSTVSILMILNNVFDDINYNHIILIFIKKVGGLGEAVKLRSLERRYTDFPQQISL